MSLLNDALKRASQSQQGHDTVRIHLPPAAPVPTPASAPKSQGGLGWALPVLVLLLVAMAVGFIWLVHLGRRVANDATVAAAPPSAQAVPVAPKPAASIPVASKLPMPPVTRQVAAAAPGAPAAHETPQIPPSVWPSLKVQGITYYNAKWQAIVNGKTVYVGDDVKGFRIAVISRTYVSFVAPDGSKKMVPFGAD